MCRCCATTKVTKNKKVKGRFWCGHCRKYFNALTDTPLEYAKIDIRKWIDAAYLLVTARKGISALQLSKELHVAYNTAWYMLMRLRIGAASSGIELEDEVEPDEMYLGGLEGNKHACKKMNQGRGATVKQAVLGMRQRNRKLVAMPLNQLKLLKFKCASWNMWWKAQRSHR